VAADNIAATFASVDLEVIRRGQDPPEHRSAPSSEGSSRCAELYATYNAQKQGQRIFDE